MRILEIITESITGYNYDPKMLVDSIYKYHPLSDAGNEIKNELDDANSLPYSVDDVIQLIDEIYYNSLENGPEGPSFREESTDLRWFRQAVKRSAQQSLR